MLKAIAAANKRSSPRQSQQEAKGLGRDFSEDEWLPFGLATAARRAALPAIGWSGIFQQAHP